MNKNIHFIGIGGIGISGLARLYLHEGWDVSGSDMQKTANTEKLIAEGVEVVYDQNKENISKRSNLVLVVYSDGVQEGTKGWPEVDAARASGVRTVSYFEALAEVANEYYLIAVAGTHGKTTTTAMLIDILEEASFDPTAIVGSLRTKTSSNYRAGKSKYFVVEACEYRRHFLHFKPDLLVITNLEHEHVDYFKDLADVQSAFRELAKKVLADGALVADTSSPQVLPVTEGLSCTVVDYRSSFDPLFALPQPGIHNQMNAAAAKAAALHLGVEEKFITEALTNFAGTKRRFEYKGDVNNAPVYDDYAHHPTEITAVIAGAREKYPNSRLIGIFQPHTYSRTKELKDDFVAALSKTDEMILVPIYAARETEDPQISSELLVELINQSGTKASHYFTLEAAAEAVKELADKDSVVLMMGAGDITNVSDFLTV